MLDPAIEAYFAERKSAWLKKSIKANMAEAQRREIEQECEEVFSLKNWLPNAAKRAGQISISTHPCTYSHPSARKNKNGYVSSIIATNKPENDGFLRAGNVAVEPDALGNAAALDVYKFLTLVMSDELNLLEHIKRETNLAKSLLELPESNYSELRSGFLQMIETSDSLVSSSKIKQVYFPVDDDEYHLLSILTHSGHLFEQRKRIDEIRFSEATKEARECKKQDKFHPKGFKEIYDITTIGYGGTKPQNISVLNNQNAGKAHLLLSAPPDLSPRSIRLPKGDFFKESLPFERCKEIYHAFHRLLITDYNNLHIREGRDYRIQEYVDLVIHKMWQLRAFINSYEGELSSNINAQQKHWLYPEYEQYRHENTEWLNQIVRQIARSFVQGYQKTLKSKALSLNDEVLLAVEQIVKSNKEALR